MKHAQLLTHYQIWVMVWITNLSKRRTRKVLTAGKLSKRRTKLSLQNVDLKKGAREVLMTYLNVTGWESWCRRGGGAEEVSIIKPSDDWDEREPLQDAIRLPGQKEKESRGGGQLGNDGKTEQSTVLWRKRRKKTEDWRATHLEDRAQTQTRARDRRAERSPEMEGNSGTTADRKTDQGAEGREI